MAEQVRVTIAGPYDGFVETEVKTVHCKEEGEALVYRWTKSKAYEGKTLTGPLRYSIGNESFVYYPDTRKTIKLGDK